MIKAKFKFSHSLKLTEIGTHADRATAEHVSQVSGDVMEKVVEGTPVKTGRAAMGWSAGVEVTGRQMPPIESNELDSTAMAEGRNLSSARLDGMRFEAENRVPYIGAIEHGSSVQPPSAAILKGMAEFRDNIKKHGLLVRIIRMT